MIHTMNAARLLDKFTCTIFNVRHWVGVREYKESPRPEIWFQSRLQRSHWILRRATFQSCKAGATKGRCPKKTAFLGNFFTLKAPQFFLPSQSSPLFLVFKTRGSHKGGRHLGENPKKSLLFLDSVPKVYWGATFQSCKAGATECSSLSLYI